MLRLFLLPMSEFAVHSLAAAFDEIFA